MDNGSQRSNLKLGIEYFLRHLGAPGDQDQSDVFVGSDIILVRSLMLLDIDIAPAPVSACTDIMHNLRLSNIVIGFPFCKPKLDTNSPSNSLVTNNCKQII